MPDNKIPFGFRQDIEPEPERERPEPSDKEINVTSASTERAWSPYVRVKARAVCDAES